MLDRGRAWHGRGRACRGGRGRIVWLCAIGAGLAASRAAGISAAAPWPLNDWHLEGQVGRSGWRGAATCALSEGCNVQLRAQGRANNELSELGASVDLTHKAGTGFELSAGLVPGARDKVRFKARLKQTMQGLPRPPTALQALRARFPQLGNLTSVLGASVTQSGVAVDAELRQPLSEDVDVSLRLRLAREQARPGLLGSAGAELGCRLGGGKLVGGLVAGAPGGTQVTAAYRLG